MLKSKWDYRALGISALIALILLLLFSSCSPLYPTNPWGEANAFFTMGRGMLAGKLPYRDLALKAGPLVCALHTLAACISSTSFLGVWILEIAALTGTLFFAWKIAVQCSGRCALSMACAALMGLLLASSRAFVFGDTVEEFALPFQLCSLWDLLDYLKADRRRLSLRRALLQGFLAGCVLWIKFWLIGVQLACIAVIAIDTMSRERGLRRAAELCLAYLAGMAISLLPWLIYFGANGALYDFFSMYFYEDWENLIVSTRPMNRALLALLSAAKNNPAAALAMLCGVAYLLRRIVQRRWRAAHTALTAAFVCAALIAYMDGNRYRFSPMALGAFLMLCAGPIALLLQFAWRQRRACGCLAAGAAMLCAAYGCWTNENLPFIGYPQSELPQMKFAQIIAENGGGSILTYDFADDGFYLAAGQLPEFKSFARSNAYFSDYDEADLIEAAQDRIDDPKSALEWEKQYSLLDENAAKWIVHRRNALYGGQYELVAHASSPYMRSTNSEKGAYDYYLFRSLEAEEMDLPAFPPT